MGFIHESLTYCLVSCYMYALEYNEEKDKNDW